MKNKDKKNNVKILGILGGGQLGRMSALAAARLGIECHIFCPENHSPASQVSSKHSCADYTDKAALRRFANSVDVITYEFENIPVETVRFLKKLKPVWPDDLLLAISQHRLYEKIFLNEIGIPTTRWRPIYNARDIEDTLTEWKTKKIILKTTRFGYDGKGQSTFQKGQDAHKAWKNFKADELIAEEIVDFKHEVSAIVVRDKKGKIACYPVCLNEHKNHILSRTLAPAPLPASLTRKAQKMATDLADAVGLVGVLTLEMFVTKSGKLLANEIAPRTHNSGHWTIDACTTSQFENHVRTICDLPIGNTTPHSHAEMLNLIGQDVAIVPRFLAKPNACVHLYGKKEIRAGRKMGHITLLTNLTKGK